MILILVARGSQDSRVNDINFLKAPVLNDFYEEVIEHRAVTIQKRREIDDTR